MDTIMYIVYSGTNNTPHHRSKPKGLRIVFNASKSHVRMLNGITQKLHVVHSGTIADAGRSLIQTVAEIVRSYEDKIYKRIPRRNY